MKKVVFILLTVIPAISFAQTANDTITNWQIYKDSELVLKSNIVNTQIDTVTISKTDAFKSLKLYIHSDFITGKTRRKLLFRRDDKLIITLIHELNSSNDPIIIPLSELKIIGFNIDKPLILEYTDGLKSKGPALCILIFEN